jgi:hypothetical protein
VFLTRGLLAGPCLLSILVSVVDPLVQALKEATMRGTAMTLSGSGKKGQARDKTSILPSLGFEPVHDTTSGKASRMSLWTILEEQLVKEPSINNLCLHAEARKGSL